jgi:hypothetical protein
MELYVPANAPWYAEFKSELLSFPAGKYDDQVDALGPIGQLLDQLEEAVASRIQGPKFRRMVVEACADLPAEASRRAAHLPGDRHTVGLPMNPSPRRHKPSPEHRALGRTPIEIQCEERFHRPIRYPHFRIV